MYHAVNVWMRLEDLVKVLFFPDVNVEVFGPLAAEKLNTIDDFIRSIIEVVHNHDLVVGLQQRESGEGANVAASSGSQSVAWLAAEQVAEVAILPGDENRAYSHLCGDRWSSIGGYSTS